MHPTLATYLTAAVLADRERAARHAALLAADTPDRPSSATSVVARVRSAGRRLAAALDLRLATPCPEAFAVPHVPDTDRG